MKGNLFKDARKQSFGYEPKEYSRHKRQVENKLSIRDKLLEIIKNDDCKNLLKYKNIIEKVLVYYNYKYNYNNKYKRDTIYDYITRDGLYDIIISNDAYECFYYVYNKSISLNVPWDVPTKYKERYFKRLMLEERVIKIKKLKDKINQEN